jgi:glycosyltransferase involved in cell wall biosynthesis
MPRILYLQYINPAYFPPVQQSSRILAEAGWEARLLGCRASAEDRMEFPPHERVELRLLPYAPPGAGQKIQYLRFLLWGLWQVMVWRPRWLYVSDTITCPAGWLLSFWPGLRVLYHEHDSPAGDAGGNAFQRLCLRARRGLAQRARAYVLPNEKRLARFAAELQPPGRAFCVWNCPALEEVKTPRRKDAGEMWLLYHGTIVPARLPDTILYALAKLPAGVKLRVIGYETLGAQGYVQKLKELAAKLNLSGRVEFNGPLSRFELMERCAENDVGLSLLPPEGEDPNEQAMVGASNKAFDYLACGLPLLVNDAPDWVNFYVTPGYALSCRPCEAESLAAAILWYWENPATRRQMGENGRQRILGDWNYERQFAPILAYLR